MIAQAAEETAHGYSRLIYAITGYPADKSRKIVHLHSPDRSYADFCCLASADSNLAWDEDIFSIYIQIISYKNFGTQFRKKENSSLGIRTSSAVLLT
jgi:hypothetical protein